MAQRDLDQLLADFFDLTQTPAGAQILDECGRDYHRITMAYRAAEAAWTKHAWERLVLACREGRMLPGRLGVYEVPVSSEDPKPTEFASHWNIPVKVSRACEASLNTDDPEKLGTKAAKAALRMLTTWLREEAEFQLQGGTKQLDGEFASAFLAVSLCLPPKPINPSKEDPDEAHAVPMADRFVLSLMDLCWVHDHKRPQFTTVPASLLALPEGSTFSKQPRWFVHIKKMNAETRLGGKDITQWVQSVTSMFRAKVRAKRAVEPPATASAPVILEPKGKPSMWVSSSTLMNECGLSAGRLRAAARRGALESKKIGKLLHYRRAQVIDLYPEHTVHLPR
ncbi:MAG TPA: hypothetical protein VD997_01795 [Phycisphaerales bacterium]|nr:hypothetical protein [Phycisphaerales bacterium]